MKPAGRLAALPEKFIKERLVNLTIFKAKTFKYPNKIPQKTALYSIKNLIKNPSVFFPLLFSENLLKNSSDSRKMEKFQYQS